MPRQARLDAPGTLHHLMIRGIEGRKIFENDRDRSEFISRIAQLVEATGIRVLAWVLMSNHTSWYLAGPRGFRFL
jgi:REP element-mobilizing transposase RayT